MDRSFRIQVMIVDDHQVVRLGLRSIVDRQPDMKVIAEASSGTEAIEMFRKHRPDVTLMDLRMKGMTGTEAANGICRDFPHAKIIVFSNYSGDEDIYRALQAGARGYILKEMLSEEVLQAIRQVQLGRKYIPAAVSEKLAERIYHSELTHREHEILELIVKGKTNKEIASILDISESTVKVHVNSILGKLGVSDRTEAATMALQRGIVYLE